VPDDHPNDGAGSDDEFARIFDDDFVRGASMQEGSHRQREREARQREIEDRRARRAERQTERYNPSRARHPSEGKVVPLRRRGWVPSSARSFALLLAAVVLVVAVGRLGHHDHPATRTDFRTVTTTPTPTAPPTIPSTSPTTRH